MSAHAWAKVWCFWFWTCVFLADVAVGFSTGTSYFDDKTLLPSKIQKIYKMKFAVTYNTKVWFEKKYTNILIMSPGEVFFGLYWLALLIWNP